MFMDDEDSACERLPPSPPQACARARPLCAALQQITGSLLASTPAGSNADAWRHQVNSVANAFATAQ